MSSTTGSTTIASATYTRDAAGNPTTVVRDGVSESYTYDSMNRATGVCYGGNVGSCNGSQLITYGYDKDGNRVTQNRFRTTTTYLYDGADELTTSITNGNQSAYVYDSDGNQVAAGATSYSYDAAKRLIQVTTSGTVKASFTYDG